MVQMKRSRRVGPCGIGALTAVVLLNYARTGSLYSQRFYSTMHQAYVFGFRWFWRTTCYDQFYSVILPCYFKLCYSIPTNALTCHGSGIGSVVIFGGGLQRTSSIVLNNGLLPFFYSWHGLSLYCACKHSIQTCLQNFQVLAT